MSAVDDTPLVFEHDDLKFTVGRREGNLSIEILNNPTPSKVALAEKTFRRLESEERFLPLNKEGFRWLASEIRLSWALALVTDLEGLLK